MTEIVAIEDNYVFVYPTESTLNELARVIQTLTERYGGQTKVAVADGTVTVLRTIVVPQAEAPEVAPAPEPEAPSAEDPEEEPAPGE